MSSSSFGPNGCARQLLWVVLVLLLAVVIGCGGHGSSGGGNGSGGEGGDSGLKYTVYWGERTRTNAPSSALSFTVRLQDLNANLVLEETRNRDANLAPHEVTYTSPVKIAAGRYTVAFDFMAQTEGAGSCVGQAIETVEITDQGFIPTIATVGAIESIMVVPGQTVDVGKTLDPAVTALNAQGETLVLSPGSGRWEVITGSQFLSAADDGTLTGIAPGTATVRVTVDGKTDSANVVVKGIPILARLKTGSATVLQAAYRDGDDIWRQATVQGSYVEARVTNPDGRYSIACFTEEDSYILNATYAECPVSDLPQRDPYPGDYSELRGTVINLGVNEYVNLQNSAGSTNIASNGPFVAAMYPTGPSWDLIATIQPGFKGILISRNRPALPSKNLVLDRSIFGTPVPSGYQVTGAVSSAVSVSCQLWTANQTAQWLSSQVGETGTYMALPSSMRSSGDRYRVSASQSATSKTHEGITKVVETPSDLEFALETRSDWPTIDPITPCPHSPGEEEKLAWQGHFTFEFPGSIKAMEARFGNYRVITTRGYAQNGHLDYTTPCFEEFGWLSGMRARSSVSALLETNNGSVSDLVDAGAMRRDGYELHVWSRQW